MFPELIRRAEADLLLAKYCLGNSDEFVVSLAAYHTQQALEKLLKAIIEESGDRYPSTHDIKELINCLPQDSAVIPDDMLARFVEASTEISEWGAKTRYTQGYKVVRGYVAKVYDMVARTCQLVKDSIDLSTVSNNIKLTPTGYQGRLRLAQEMLLEAGCDASIQFIQEHTKNDPMRELLDIADAWRKEGRKND